MEWFFVFFRNIIITIYNLFDYKQILKHYLKILLFSSSNLFFSYFRKAKNCIRMTTHMII